MLRYPYILLLLTLFTTGCNEFSQAVKDAKKETQAPPKDNYIVLLDLSDRILHNNQQQVAKDIAIVKYIYGAFKAKLDSKDPSHLFYTVNDKLKVLVAPQKSTPKGVYEQVGALRIELSAEQPEKKAGLIEETAKVIDSSLPAIYKQAVISNNGAAYTGADIWKYFNEDLKDDLEKNTPTTLFIVTDGYMNFQHLEGRAIQNNRFTSCSQIINTLKKYPDWNKKFDTEDFGLLPIHKKFENLQVVLVPVSARPDWDEEYSLLTKIWAKWFTEMGITNYHFIKDDNINEVKESIEKFVQVRITTKVALQPWQAISDTPNPANSVLATAITAGYENSTLQDTVGLLVAKKKDYPLPQKNIDTPGIQSRAGSKKNNTLKKTAKQTDQVSFGPTY